jgi:cytochrome c553
MRSLRTVKIISLLSGLAAATAAVSAAAAPSAAADKPLPDQIEFNRDIRPILSNNCFKCHGFDKNHREGKRRLDTKEGALADHEGIKAIVPGKLEESEVHLRIRSTDKDEMMPPPKSGKKITDRERAILDRWIAQGAEYQPEWAYIVPKRPAVPEEADAAFVKNPIDALVLARQHELRLQHAPEADKPTLLRRLSLDLTGLPPSQSDVDAFVADRTPDAYEKRVDQLLASPAFGERLAVYWLDVVRYADSIGYHSDVPRNVWPYRDYVIQSFNENKPFDQFTIEQLAGDLLPGSTTWQKVASGFNLLNLTTEEGGAQAKDYEARTVTDRVRAIGTVWLAQTTGCCQCHDHKFDPIKTRDFYRLGAFFADIKENAIGRREEGMLVPTPEQDAKLKELGAQIDATRSKIITPNPEFDAAEAAWERVARELGSADGAWEPLASGLKTVSAKGSSFTVEKDGAVLIARAANSGVDTYTVRVKTKLDSVTGFRLEALADAKLPESGPGRGGSGNFVLNGFSAALELPGGKQQPVKLIHATAAFEQSGFPAAAAINGITGKADHGWAVLGGTGQDQAIYFELAAPLTGPGEKTLVFTLRQEAGGNRTLGKFRLAATTAPGLVRAPAFKPVPKEIGEALQTPPLQRTVEQRNRVTGYFRLITPTLARERVRLSALMEERANFEKEIPRCLVSESMPQPRIVRILPRGNWQDESGEIVEPGVPEFLAQPANADGHRLTRLDLAHWLVSRDNPLTARVFVNRLWKLYFGIGLSKVLDDFGAQGEPPVNPPLLDWLASEFMDSGWNIKHMARLMVTSGSYRQSSQCSQALQQRDPYNREVARQSRFRLDAEFVRDNALAISGLLVRTVGGPSVKPYQPAGYWENLNFPVREWQDSTDENQWRRGLYTWWQRSYMHPSLLAFDAPTREECTAERARSNIPQQALALLNDPTFVEAARAFAARILRQGGKESGDRLAWAFREALSRPPRADEVQTLSALLEKERSLYAADPASAGELVKIGLSPSPKDLNVSELAAWTNIARVILNLHETITRF